MILDGLNDAQRAAVTAVRGPVCILAGAGTGKTTTITRRIAHQIASGTFRADEILAVTFTDRAANEMRSRLEGLGAGRVRARTFHAEALAQLARFGTAPALLDSKARVIAPLVRRLPPPYRFRATKDVASEIERAKNRRVGPKRYLDDLDGHTPPMPPELMARVYGEYEARKRRMGRIDFEDLLEEAIRVLRETEAGDAVRDRYRAFTVDEYQDVNLLQQTLLDEWLGPRDEVCVVGDDQQAIFGFTGASPAYLLSFQRRFPGARLVTLAENHRSTPEVLHVANRLGGRPLRGVPGPGPEPVLREHATGEEETESIARQATRLVADGVAPQEIAILYRINARSEDYEEALSAAGIPFQVRDGAFLRRPGPRAVLAALSRADKAALAAPATERIAGELGWDPDGEHEGAEEITRQQDLTRLIRMAEGTVGEFLADLRARFSQESQGRGVVLSTYHRAKGLEFDAVFLPRLEERELPFALSKSEEDMAEERRLLYVGITRARRHLTISWGRSRDGKSVRPSRFVRELMPQPAQPVNRSSRIAQAPSAPEDPELFSRLRRWRSGVASRSGMPPYCVFHDATLRTICELRPSTLVELGRVSGVGPNKLARYGADVLKLVEESPTST